MSVQRTARYFAISFAVLAASIVVLNVVACYQCRRLAGHLIGKDPKIVWRGCSPSWSHGLVVSFDTPDGPEKSIHWYAVPFGEMHLMQ